jgi:hypothetical protein
MDGRAASQLITPRIPILKELGVSCSVISAPSGCHDLAPLSHHRVFSLSPSGLRFELRHFIRRVIPSKIISKLVLFNISCAVFPFYLAEKIFVRLESQWSWFFSAYILGFFISRKNKKFDIIYSTGGPFSSHIAAILLSKTYGIPCICEIQDPLVFDDPEWKPKGRSTTLYRLIERFICKNANIVVFLTQTAMRNAMARTKLNTTNFHFVYSGAPSVRGSGLLQRNYINPEIKMAHFGTLAGDRNLDELLTGLMSVFSDKPKLKYLINVLLYGNLEQSVKDSIEKSPIKKVVFTEGFIPHETAIDRMNECDVLLLIQDKSFVAHETIPSKVFEYLQSGKTILALVDNEELFCMLKKYNCYVANIYEQASVRRCLHQIFCDFNENALIKPQGDFVKLAKSVEKIQGIAEGLYSIVD